MAKQHIHVCMNHMHTHINTHAHTSGREGEGRERAHSSRFVSGGFGSLRVILKVQAIDVSTWCLTGHRGARGMGGGLSEELNSVLGVKGPSIP